MWRILLVVGLAIMTVAGFEQPADAHGVSGAEATNYEVEIDSMTPDVEGVEIRVVELGSAFEVRNTTDEELVVLGYLGEPYLRVGPEGVLENRASPSWVANQSPDETIPEDSTETVAQVWVRVGSGDAVRWHDHRAHWMGSEPTEGSEPTLRTFEVDMRHAGRPIAVEGRVVWTPGPTPWVWVIVALMLAVVVVALSRTPVWTWVLGAGLVLLIGTETAHVVGVWGATSGALSTKLAASVYSLAAIGIAVGAVAWLATARDPYDATPLVLVGGLFLAVAGGFADLTTLTHSQLPTTLSPGLARAAVAVALGLGTGITVAAALRIRRPAPTRSA